MPSRTARVLILLFWLTTLAVVGYRDIWPRLFADVPPPISIDLADEATQSSPTRWKVYRGEQVIGQLQTRIDYVSADDSFRFVNSYSNVRFEMAAITVVLPRFETAVRVSRSGDLKEQQTSGKLEAQMLGLTVATGTADIQAKVVNGELVGHCKLVDSPFGNIDQPLDPVPVSGGQVLNPMMPVNRLKDVTPGRRWVIRESDPLRDAVMILMREVARKNQFTSLQFPNAGNKELLAEVKAAPEKLVRRLGEPVECWVIEYRGDDVQARTWVAVADGRVFRQEASGFGEKLRFEREE